MSYMSYMMMYVVLDDYDVFNGSMMIMMFMMHDVYLNMMMSSILSMLYVMNVSCIMLRNRPRTHP